MSEQQFDVLVIGGGSGLTVAHHAQAAGKRVAIVERDSLGGTCVNRGCIPTKNLIQSAKVLHTIRKAGDFGVEVEDKAVSVDFPAIMTRVRGYREEGRSGAGDWVESVEGFTLFRGEGSFVGEKTFEVDGTRIRADRVFIAAGARAAVPPIEGLEDVPYLTNRSVLELTEQPRRLVILGGGYVGCELAYFFSMVGTEVIVLERGEVLGAEDDDVREAFRGPFTELVNLKEGHTVTKVEGAEGDLTVHAETEDGGAAAFEADAVLVALGRRSNADTLALDKTGVSLTEQGWIEVDDELRTTNPDIFAFGDVIGQGMFKHTASYEAGLAWRNSEGAGEAVNYRANPHAVFSYPEIGGVGLTEAQAKEAGLAYRVVKGSYEDIAKGDLVQAPKGVAKLLLEEGTDRILGFHLCGPDAANLVHEVVVAMNCGDGIVGPLKDAIHIHPTLSELVGTLVAGA